METIYENADVKIQLERDDKHEGKVYCNGELLIWISWSEKEKFVDELKSVFDKYRI